MDTTSRFSTLEFLRIILPGSFLVLLLILSAAAFRVPLHPFDSWLSGIPFVLLGSVVAGLSVYSKETPKQRKAFRQNQPSLYLLERSRAIGGTRPLSDDEARRLYFYILNHHLPAAMQEKIFFFGLLYHVVTNLRRISFWFGTLGIGAAIIMIAMTGTIDRAPVALLAVIWTIYALFVRHNKADRKMQENYQDQIFWLEMHRDTVDQLIRQRTHTP